ncbi:isochorismate synthase [Oceanirhabdus sp. W0125-5]|uniref:isochorismate synthase n=1 Tax=Oceanirhabdus sp. W0125-5 TaxID=2999116 RepID=UPI0022F2B33C|nr:isochorismate synthase [Oceanirhabdus sp. W0125-5]WBW97249.1 isochorismate synthase [Oceanirhabdus sp. W0125-5]
MVYKKKKLKLNNPLSFWNHFKNEERFLFYNPLKKELIMGAQRLKAISSKEELKNSLYAFSSMTFFNTIKDEKWSSIGNETIVFEYYLVIKDGVQILYYFKDLVEIENIQIKISKHSYELSSDDYEEWRELFSNVHNEIISQKVNKVVISREVKIQCDISVNVESVLQNLIDKNPNSFSFAYYKNGKTFLGATPEVLIQKEKNTILSYALAGTIPRSEIDDELRKETLLNDSKNLYEHKIVIDSIVNTMNQYTNEIKVDKTGILTLKNLHHLHTNICAKDKKSTILEWVKRLHPTPALGGNPTITALELIKKYEKHERGLYASPIGIIDGNGDGIFVVGIRSALIEGNEIYAYTGCGVVEKSDCKDEYIETKNKLKTIIESL